MIAGNAFEYTVDRILKKRCVPVAGAGISVGSVPPSGEWVHNVSWMVDTLKKKLISLRMARYIPVEHGAVCKCWCSSELKTLGHSIVDDSCQDNCFFCDVIKAAGSNQLGCLSELFLWEYECLQDAYKELVELLKIEIYKDLNPTAAHKIIAKLSREGLINEIITTNYDCNFEKAYVDISGGDNSDVISSLDDYRRKGAEIGPIHRLKVYKVNGCAENLSDFTFEKRYESILLTERQLQKWRNRQWAADVFRDRLRSKSLLFIGFGSDEPQVHHTLQTVLDEYTDELEKNEMEVLDTHSAPIVAIYDSHPSFHQQQIVKTYALHHKDNPQEGDKLIIRNPVMGDSLSADELWQLIYERVMRATVIEALKSSLKAMNASFTSVVPFAENILHQIISSFENPGEEDCGYSTVAPKWLVNFSLIVASSTEQDGLFATLVSGLTELNGVPKHQYEPVNENKALLSEFTTLLFLLRRVLSSHVESSSGNGLSLAFKASAGNSVSEKILYLNADPAIVSTGDEVGLPNGNNHLTLALGQAGAHIRPSLRRVTNKDKLAGTIRPKTMVTLGWQHVFHQNPYAGNKDAVASTLLDAVESPTNYFYANQSSIKRRSYLRES